MLYMGNWGCLFDVDGVIIDSETQYSIFWDGIEAIYPTGIPGYSMKIKGSTLPVILSKYYNSESVRQDILTRLERFEDTMPLNIFPGVIDFLQQLQAAGVPCAIVTSSTRAKMERLQRLHPELWPYFAAVIDGEMVSSPKPAPECYQKGASLIGLQPERCVVFEDSINGIKAGKAAGAYLVALSTTLPVESLKTMEPDMIIPSFAGFHVSTLIDAIGERLVSKP